MPALTLTIIDPARADADDLRALRGWLADDAQLRGRVTLRQAEPGPGELGTIADALIVALGPSGVGVALVGALLAWLRHRVTDVDVRLTRADGASFEVSARRVRGLDASALAEEIAQLGRMVEPAASPVAEPLPAGQTQDTGPT